MEPTSLHSALEITVPLKSLSITSGRKYLLDQYNKFSTAKPVIDSTEQTVMDPTLTLLKSMGIQPLSDVLAALKVSKQCHFLGYTGFDTAAR